MANALYTNLGNELLKGNINVTSDTIKAALMTSSYVFNEAHRYWDEASGALIGEVTLANCNVVQGAFDSDDPTWSSQTGTVASIVIYKDTGTDSTSPLMAYIDTDSSGAAISATPAAEDVTFVIDNTAVRWFRLATSSTDTTQDTLLAFTSSTVTSATTATIGQHVLFDASGGTFTITAPASPSRDDTFGIKNNANTDATTITVSGNSNNIEDPAGGGATGTSITIGEANCSYVWQYDGTDWVIVP